MMGESSTVLDSKGKLSRGVEDNVKTNLNQIYHFCPIENDDRWLMRSLQNLSFLHLLLQYLPTHLVY